MLFGVPGNRSMLRLLMRVTIGSIALVAVLAGGLSTATAQLTDPAAAEALFQEGRRLIKADEVLAACSKFDESLRLDPAIGTLINVAACQERLGRTATAWQHWRAAADQLPTTDKRRAMAIRHATALEKVLGRLSLTLGPNVANPEQVEVRRDGIRLGPASLGLPLPLDPGIHLVEVLAPGRQPSRYEIAVRPGDSRTLLVEPGPEVDQLAERQAAGTSLSLPAPMPNPPPAPESASSSSSGSLPPVLLQTERPAVRTGLPLRNYAGWAMIGTGAVAAGVAGYFAFQALEARRDAVPSCPGQGIERVCRRSGTPALDRDRRSSISTDIALAAGAMLVGGGLFLLNRDFSESTSGATVYLAPLSTGGEAGLMAKF